MLKRQAEELETLLRLALPSEARRVGERLRKLSWPGTLTRRGAGDVFLLSSIDRQGAVDEEVARWDGVAWHLLAVREEAAAREQIDQQTERGVAQEVLHERHAELEGDEEEVAR